MRGGRSDSPQSRASGSLRGRRQDAALVPRTQSARAKPGLGEGGLAQGGVPSSSHLRPKGSMDTTAWCKDPVPKAAAWLQEM